MSVPLRMAGTLDGYAAAPDEPAWVQMWRDGHGAENAANVAYLRRHRAEIEANLCG